MKLNGSPFGFCVSDIKATKKKIKNLAALAPDFDRRRQNTFGDRQCGVTTTLRYVFEEVEGMKFKIAWDKDANEYLVLVDTGSYGLSETSEIIGKYIKMLTKKKIAIGSIPV